MNRIFTTTWNESRQQWVVASELASGGGRPKLSTKKRALALLLGAVLLPSTPVLAIDYVGDTLDGDGASQTLNAGDTATSTTINSGGYQYVSSGGFATDTVINSGGWQNVYSGGSAAGTTISDGTQQVFGGSVTDTTLNNGRQFVSGGSAIGTIINGGWQRVHSDGMATSTTINSGGTQYVDNGGSAINTNIYNAGRQYISNGGSATETTLNGGTQVISSGGSATATIMNSGLNTRQFVLDGGVATDSTLNGGAQLISSGGSATDTTLNGGTQYVYSGGTTENTTLNGGQSWLLTGALAGGETVINAGGEMLMEAGSRATDVILSGGTLSVTDLTDDTTSYTPAQVDKLTMNGGNVSFLRDSDGDFAALHIAELSGSGNFLFNTSLAERNANFVTIEQGTGHFGIAVTDSGKEIADHDDLTVNLIHDQGGDVDFSMVTADGRSTGAVDGGTYMYTLYSAQDKDGLNGGNVWYLGAMEDDNNGDDNNNGDDDNNGGNGGGAGNLTTTPATDAVLSLSTAGLNVMRGELDGLRAYRNGQTRDRQHGESNVWGHYLGKKSAIDTSNGAAYKLHQSGVELGGDITTGFDRGSLVTGGFVTLSGNRVDHARGGRSNIDSYGVGAYATWYDNRGFYVDGTLKANRLESDLSARMTNGDMTSGSWHQYGISTAVETGFTFRPVDALRIEPYVRMTGTHINSANVALSNGMKANTGSARSLTAEAGTRVGSAFSVGNTGLMPYLQVGVEQEMVKSNQSTINGVHRFDNNLNGTSGKYGAGLSATLAGNVTLYGEVNYRQGSHIEEPVQGVAGMRIGF